MLRSSALPSSFSSIQRGDLARPADAHDLEWLEVDGRGGYSSGTVSGCPTRRYHGLLSARPAAGAPRHLFLSRFEERVARRAGQSLDFSVARYGDVLSPRGDQAFDSFELRPWPWTRLVQDGLELTREVLRVRGRPIVLVRYRLRGSRPGDVLELRPLFAFREADALTYENDVLDGRLRAEPQGYAFQPYAGLPFVRMQIGAAAHAFAADPQWYRGLTYSLDEARGYESKEDQFSPGVLRLPLDVGGEIVLSASVGEAPGDPRAAFEREARSRRGRAQGLARDALGRATLAADDFLYLSESGRAGVLAGFPWFGEWGRDTFIALPGLTLARGDLAACRAVLDGSLPFLRQGLLPNIFGATPDTSHYGSADAALWFARAVGLYRRAGAAPESLIEHYRPALASIVASYREGTDLGLEVTPEGLLRAGTEELNATWMDARASDGPVTPRPGCAVELNALWYALLCELEELHRLAKAKKSQAETQRIREQAGRAFVDQFWLAERGHLADCVDGTTRDESLRPNMILAAALEDSPLTRKQRSSIVECARRALLTPQGLRTLGPGEEGYCPRYEGDPDQRDRAYHQGTVWPWLLGFYTEARLRAASQSARERDSLQSLWSDLEAEMDRAGLNHISEVFDGEEPRRPGGTFAQAWNTAEYLRARALLQQEDSCES